MCTACADDRDGPAALLARRYATLARDIDRDLYDILAQDA